MKTPEHLDGHSSAETGGKRGPVLCAFLGMTGVIVLAACAYDGSYGGSYSYPGPYQSRGYYYGGIHRGYSYGIQHGFGRSGFGHRGSGGGGRRH